LDALLFIMLAVEGNANANASIVLYSLPWLIIVVVIGSTLVCLPLDDKPATASWDKAFENRGELFGDLLEGTLYGFIFSLIKYADQFFD